MSTNEQLHDTTFDDTLSGTTAISLLLKVQGLRAHPPHFVVGIATPYCCPENRCYSSCSVVSVTLTDAEIMAGQKEVEVQVNWTPRLSLTEAEIKPLDQR